LSAVNQGVALSTLVVEAATGIGVDSTSANSAQMYGSKVPASYTQTNAQYRGYIAAGYHYIQRLEISEASGTTTWAGDLNGVLTKSGMLVVMEM